MVADSVLVVGGGIVGLATALGLARRGRPVTVVERAPGPDTTSHDHGYNWPVLPGLAGLGVLDDAVSAGTVVTEWRCTVLATGERIRFDYGVLADVVPHAFCLNLPHDRMARLLVDRLERHSGAEVLWGTEVTGLEQDGAGVTVSVRGPDGDAPLRAAWVVGADGARSVVRRGLGLGLAGTTWAERLVAADVRLDLAALGHTPRHYVLDQDGGAITSLFDAPDGWRVVMAENRGLPVEGAQERLVAGLTRVLPDAGPLPVGPVGGSRIHERAVERMRAGRVLLAGDAAHLTNPTAGLGMTAGLLDAFSLAEALSEVAEGGRSDDALDDYSGTRLHAFWDDVVPPSSEAKSLVFPSTVEGARLDAALGVLREASADPLVQREFLLRLGGAPASPVSA
ncbi:FAD-dependent oxidoreductase [Geodermatophilus sabuli]|uniref:3-(3-hydroxy-phenyl)propionate hydroxylase/6-hydroxy-3-succinoylpyridine 3-monooxygenase n=1 Tax=Geodermatophilus sabuli TaxID=1564158 RepID=A0A285E6K9_9ACTN|nr:FAD-dependent oxidoreductase [Geodermatophilus sabuli]MBB3082381.1 3-(3-hydroxy-phenyl)propionate hydroxylase/6-hydroxy-3-succinoylpyridine 3-monooxygenase [Geodermatophilus sabuli]SNX94749.1 3-(3-hydroxy-phenyl)propionate hydroxylase/6-hydroxy-3-succinoylpyridine 3-monooxygenase [Geodermatophilus sabuli]